MDAASIVADTQRARFCPQTDRRTDGLCETSAPRFNFIECVCVCVCVGGGGGGGGGGYNKNKTVWNGLNSSKFGASGGALHTESQTRINPLIDIHNWVLDDHNSIMTIHGLYS